MTAGQAQPQVNPGVTNLQAIFTAFGARYYFANLIEMCAGHDLLSRSKLHSLRYNNPLIHPPSTGIDVPVM